MCSGVDTIVLITLPTGSEIGISEGGEARNASRGVYTVPLVRSGVGAVVCIMVRCLLGRSDDVFQHGRGFDAAEGYMFVYVTSRRSGVWH